MPPAAPHNFEVAFKNFHHIHYGKDLNHISNNLLTVSNSKNKLSDDEVVHSLGLPLLPGFCFLYLATMLCFEPIAKKDLSIP